MALCLDSHILEEFEKNDSRVPKWKVEWVRENLMTMIGKDDTGPAKKKTTLGGAKKLSKKKSTLRKSAKKSPKKAQQKQV